MLECIYAEGKVIVGYGAASGRNRLQEIGGTIHAQKRHFEHLGLPMHRYFCGTLNVDIKPLEFLPLCSKLTLLNVKWHPSRAAENFSFFDVTIHFEELHCDALVYLPHPETKVGFEEQFPPMTTLEILAPRIEGIRTGSRLAIEAAFGSIRFEPYRAGDVRHSSAHGSLAFVEQQPATQTKS